MSRALGVARGLLKGPNMRKSWAVLVLIALGGCDMYFGGDDQPCKYDYGTGGGALVPAQQLRDPSTGQCQYIGGYPYPCDSQCGPCPEATGAAEPNWGSCYSQCEGLAEQSCIETAGCFAAYLDNPTPNSGTTFYGCWQTAPSGPIHGTCTGLDAQSCSEHDDCSAQYTSSNSTVLQFAACVPENGHGACTGTTCSTGYHCEEQCYGDPATNMMDVCQGICVQDLTCASVDCGLGYTCSEVCAPDSNGKTVCHPACVASASCESLTDEPSCQNRSDCTPVYAGTDCTCTINGCTCQNLTYERCETL